MDQICSLMDTTMRQSAGDSGLPIGLPRRCRMQRWPNQRFACQGRGEKGWDILNDDFPSDVQSTERATFDGISWIISFPWVDRENFVVRHIHVGSKKIQEHEPCPNESFLVDASEETSQI